LKFLHGFIRSITKEHHSNLYLQAVTPPYCSESGGSLFLFIRNQADHYCTMTVNLLAEAWVRDYTVMFGQ
jgi:hypothetical protein